MNPPARFVLVLSLVAWLSGAAFAQESAIRDAAPEIAVAGSLVEDRAARKLLEAGDARQEADDAAKAVEVWQSVIERYPRSRVRFEAHLRLGNYFLERERAYDRARAHFRAVAAEENRDEEQRAEATLKLGICFYEARNYGQSFQVMRDVIEQFPVSPQVNQAYYYIGLGHFQLAHYSRAIDALEKVGTTLSGEAGGVDKLEAGKRFFVKIEDADLAALDPGQAVEVACTVTSGDAERVKCFPVGRNVRIVLGSIPTRLGQPQADNGTLEVRGDDIVTVTYVDQHTADKQFDRPRSQEISVVGNAIVSITDGAFSETLQGVVLGKPVNVQIIDADRDLSDESDSITALVEVYRAKTAEEIEAEAVQAAATKDTTEKPATTRETNLEAAEETEPEIDPLKKIDAMDVILTEAKIAPQDATGKADDAGDSESSASGSGSTSPAQPADPSKTPDGDDGSIHTGVFRSTVSLVRSETADPDDDVLQALPGDVVRVTYLDERNIGEGVGSILQQARCIEGNLGGVRVTRAVISDQELRIQTRLKTAGALTNIGNRYKEFGLKSNADAKYAEALAVCDEIMRDAQLLGGRLLEETYVQLWKIYYEMDNLGLASAMAQRLQDGFPESGFVDDALLQLADVARKQGNLQRAIGIYSRLVAMPNSDLKGEAQFGVALCYEQMADAADGNSAAQLHDRAFQEYKKVFDNFPESGRVGEAVAKMANFYYQQKDYARAIDTFETVLSDYPDAKFLDVILFNYGRCLYRMEQKGPARQKFDQLIGDFPESPLASDAKRISEALAKSGF